MSEPAPHPYAAFLARIVSVVVARPVATLLIAALLTVTAGWVTATGLGMNSSPYHLIRQDAQFRVNEDEYDRVFPMDTRVILVVVSGEAADRVEEATERLTAALATRDDVLGPVFAPSIHPFFERHALLYLEEEELERVVDDLAQAQPALTALARDPTLRGLFSLIDDGLEARADGRELPAGFDRIVNLVADTTENVLEGRPETGSWNERFLGTDAAPDYRLIVTQANLDFAETSAGARAVEGIRAEIAALGLDNDPAVNVRLTGSVPLSHEELESAQASAQLAGLVSLILLTVILGIGIRSWRLILAVAVTLSVGLIWTGAWATLSVGELNILSVAFAVLFIGLGVDFAIHLGLRYADFIEWGEGHERAMVDATRAVGGAVSLCALTSAIGFLAFMPTAYRGLAELGIIAGGGMILALAATFTVMPALIVLTRPSRAARIRSGAVGRHLRRTVEYQPRALVFAGLALGLAGIVIATGTRFDFSTLSLKDPHSESVTTLYEIEDEGVVTHYSANVLAPDMEAAQNIADRLAALPEVDEARTPLDYLPENQEEKLFLLEEAALFLWPAFSAERRRGPLDAEARVDLIRRTGTRLAATEPVPADPKGRVDAMHRLGAALQTLAGRENAEELSAALERRLIGPFEERLQWLQDALGVGPVSFDDLPADLRAREIAPDGRVRIVAIPAGDMSDVGELRAFVDAVYSVSPDASGRPGLEAGVGRIVVASFQTAIGIALGAILIVVLVALRRIDDTLLVMLPIALAGGLTIATGVLIDLPFNMANIIVLPLILGLGVDNGIHVVAHFRKFGSIENLFTSSTPRAVILSGLTTAAAFGALGISSHQGIRSMGLLLAIAIVYLLVATIVFLPAFLSYREHRRGIDKTGESR